ncbi:unnamed protein product [Schistocephalus solidus]|uniref:RT_RNaseH_2 domain-containing protein n=1 Tax=Schistocephalus solidus TaxID=70667 RepID=A0A183TSK9_SCHSO|nr:unnamed protein product [Schistocephalus solidus]
MDTEGAAAYLAGIIVIGSDPDELLQRLEIVLSRIQDYGFRLRLDKCNFFPAFCEILQIVVAADASNYGNATVISYIFPENAEKAICHAARSLKSAERNFGGIEKEDLAIILVVKTFIRCFMAVISPF